MDNFPVKKKLMDNFDCPYLIMGDFNQIVDITERKGKIRDNSGMRLFREWISDRLLIDVPWQGRKYAWRRGNTIGKIDTCLSVSSWFQKFMLLSHSY